MKKCLKTIFVQKQCTVENMGNLNEGPARDFVFVHSFGISVILVRDRSIGDRLFLVYAPASHGCHFVYVLEWDMVTFNDRANGS